MKKRKNVLPQNVMTWLSRGSGQGVGSNYTPFFHVRDVPSRGRSSIFFCPKTGRVHHYLSELEFKLHILAAFNKKVNDIREQFALLPWLEPAEIADGLGIRYPTYPLGVIALLVMGSMANPTVLFLPLGIPIFLGKMFGGSKIIGTFFSFISYGTVLGLLILVLTAYEKRKFIRAISFLCVVLLLNFAGCSSMGRFIVTLPLH